jgi:hypothetical protein
MDGWSGLWSAGFVIIERNAEEVYEINREISAHPFWPRAAPTRDLITTTQYRRQICEFTAEKSRSSSRRKGGAECK